MADKELKSSYELAMERLRKQGADAPRSLTPEQKEEIARLRREAQAKLAELEILHDKNMAAHPQDPEKLTETEEHYQIDRRRVESSLESAIAKIKKG